MRIAPREPPAPGPGEGYLWAVDIDQLERAGVLTTYLDSLSACELARMNRFHFLANRREFIAAHGLVRAALSWCAPGTRPAEWVFQSTRHGRPELTGAGAGLRFNLSHTEGTVACVVTVDIDCGVDIETIDRTTDLALLAKTFLSPHEARHVNEAQGAERRMSFFRFWTLKEAYAKARGLGLSLPFDRCTFGWDAEGISLQVNPPVADDPAAWTFGQWTVGGGHVLSVAIRTGDGPRGGITYHPTTPDGQCPGVVLRPTGNASDGAGPTAASHQSDAGRGDARRARMAAISSKGVPFK